MKSSRKATTIKLFKISEAKEIASFEIPEQLEAIAITPDGKHLVGISKSNKTDKEKRTKTPTGFKKLEKLEFEQQNDERMAKVIWFDAAGNVNEQQETWYSSGNGTRLLMPTAEAVYVINYQNKNAIIPKKGEASHFQLTTSYNYGIGISPDQTQVGTGGLRDGSVTKLEDLTNASTFKINSLPSWPEYFKGFTIVEDGTAYAVTTAYRLAKVKPNGEIEKIVPIF